MYPRRTDCISDKMVDRRDAGSKQRLRKDDDTSQPTNKPPSSEGTASSTPEKCIAPNPANTEILFSSIFVILTINFVQRATRILQSIRKRIQFV